MMMLTIMMTAMMSLMMFSVTMVMMKQAIDEYSDDFIDEEDGGVMARVSTTQRMTTMTIIIESTAQHNK